MDISDSLKNGSSELNDKSAITIGKVILVLSDQFKFRYISKLFSLHVWSYASCLVLPCSLSMRFFCPFSILITLLGEELIVHLFVSYAHVNLCHFFSSSWCRELAAASACGSSWTFLFTFLHENDLKLNYKN